MIRAVLATAILLGSSGLAHGQSPPAPAQEPAAQEPAQVEDVIVNGRSLEQLSTRFVDEVGQPTLRWRGLARWFGPVCIGVANFHRDTAQHIADSLATIGGEMGVPINDGACSPNVLVIGATDSRAVAAEWVRTRGWAFHRDGSQGVGRPSTLEWFTDADVPVRWWHVSVPMHVDQMTGRVGTGNQRYVLAKSQLWPRRRADLQQITIIVDVDKVEGVTVDQLCSYLAMLAFSQVDPEADTTGFDSILNLFKDPDSPDGLSVWDRAYLTSMYAAREDRRLSAGDQAQGIASILRTEDAGSTGVAEPR